MTVPQRVRKIVYFKDPQTGRMPAKEWIEALRDTLGRESIMARIWRAKEGNLGDFRSVGDGVIEMRIFAGPGYRVYFGLDEERSTILILSAGVKSTQWKDIIIAKRFWVEYWE